MDSSLRQVCYKIQEQINNSMLRLFGKAYKTTTQADFTFFLIHREDFWNFYYFYVYVYAYLF